MRPLNLLLVEDNDDHARLIKDTIHDTSSEHAVVRVTQGEEALTHLNDCTEDNWPDVVLLDLKMPMLGGIETLTAIRSQPRLKDLPVVIVSTSSSRDEIQSSFSHGASSYLIKPLHFNDLTIMIRDFVHYWSHVSQTPGFRT